MLFDTHCHLTLSKISVEEQITLSHSAGVERWVDAGVHPSDFEARHQALSGITGVQTACAFAPHQAHTRKDGDIEYIEEIFKSGRARIMSEIGLEYHHQKDKEVLASQRELFEKQLEIAVKYNAPVTLHIRDAWEDAIEILSRIRPVRCAVHCFTGTAAEAEALLALGLSLSFSGIITFDSSSSLRGALQITPLDKILTETDSPWLSPAPLRGRTNNSANLAIINSFIAGFLKIELAEFQDIISRNAGSFFYGDNT